MNIFLESGLYCLYKNLYLFFFNFFLCLKFVKILGLYLNLVLFRSDLVPWDKSLFLFFLVLLLLLLHFLIVKIQG